VDEHELGKDAAGSKQTNQNSLYGKSFSIASSIEIKTFYTDEK